MEISSTRSAENGTLGAPSAASTPSALGPDAFLRLLITQIRNQDPMQPMDTEGMMSQLTQLTSVERLVAIDDRLATLSVATAGIGNSQAADLVGRTVEADTSHVSLPEGGSVRGAFELQAGAQTVEVELRDEAGRVVRTLSIGAHAVGPTTFEWDGRTDSGDLAEPGRYRVSVTARTADGRDVDAEMTIHGRVDSIGYDSGYPTLSIAGFDVMMGDIRRVEGSSTPSITASVPPTVPAVPVP